MLTIDGNYHEGGGQILRNALALSTITRKSFDMHSIRQGRSKPGLKAQHKHSILALKDLCDAKFTDVYEGSEAISFYPGIIKGGSYNIDIGTAGSITLILQSLLLPSLFTEKPTTWKIHGGTDVNWSPSFDYFANILAPNLQRFANINIKLEKRGYYPKGGGKAIIKINPKYNINKFDTFQEFKEHLKDNIKPFQLEQRYELVKIGGVAHCSRLLEGVADRLADSARSLLLSIKAPQDIRIEYRDTLSEGAGITLWAVFSDGEHTQFLGTDKLGEKGVRAEKIGAECAQELINKINSGCPTDEHLADQLIPFAALLPNSSIWTNKLTPHTLTNIWTTEQFLGKTFNIDEKNNIITTIN